MNQDTLNKVTGETLRFGLYRSGEIAIEIIDKKGDFYPDSIAGERITTATVALSEYGVAPSTGCVWLKGWSENEGLPERLQEIGVVRLTGRAAPCGYAVAQEGELTPAGLAAIAAAKVAING